MVEEILKLVVGVLGAAAGAVLVEGAEAALGAVRASNLLYGEVLACTFPKQLMCPLTASAEVTVAAAASNQVADLVVDGLERGARVGVAHEGAAAVDAEGHGRGGKEEDGGELHCGCG